MSFNLDEVWANLRTHRVQVVQELRVDRTLLFDYLRSKAVFDSEDCELVQAERTNERKASRLLDILQTKATESLVHFLDVVQLLNPGLYEKLTGQKATARENPIIKNFGDQTFTDLDPQRDLDILSNHLKRAVVDLQEMTLGYDRLLKDNQQLSKRLSKVTDERDMNSKRLQTAEDQVVKAEERAKEACDNARKAEEAAYFQRKECEKAKKNRHTYLLAFSMKILSSEEEGKQLRKQVEDEKQRNEELMSKLEELSQNFDHERRHSLQLSQTLSRQRSSIKMAESLSTRYRDLQFISQKLQIERDQAISERNELKDWAEALMARYDIVEKNKQQCEESYENVVVDCSQFRKQIQELQFQLSVSQRQVLNVKAHNDELARKVTKYQEQRDFYDEERIKAINERDEARKERDEMYHQYIEAQKEKDEALKRFLLETTELDRRHEIDTAKMEALSERLMRTEEKFKALKMEKEIPLSIQPSTLVSGNVKPPDIVITENSAQQPLQNDGNDGTDDSDVDDDVFAKGIKAIQGYKSTNSVKLVNSIKNRFYNSSENLSPLDIPSEDSEMLRAQWLSRLPCQVLMNMLCHNSSKRSSGDISPAASFKFDFLPSSPTLDGDIGVSSFSRCSTPMDDDLFDVEDPQELPKKVDCLDGPYLTDDIIISEPRPRANALDRSSRTPRPRPFHRVGTAP